MEPPLVDAVRIGVGMMRRRGKVVHSLKIVQFRLQNGKRVVFGAFSNAADHLPQIAALGELQRESMPEICFEIGANALRDRWQLLDRRAHSRIRRQDRVVSDVGVLADFSDVTVLEDTAVASSTDLERLLEAALVQQVYQLRVMR